MPPFPYRNIIPLRHLSQQDRQIVIGKHSGRAAVVNKFKEYNIDLTEDESKGILELVRSTSVRLKRSLFDKEVVQLYKEYHRRLDEKKVQ